MGLNSSSEPFEKWDLLNELMDTYGQQVWDYALILTRKTHLADDITQEVFLKVYSGFQSFRGDSSVRTWLFSITRNLVYDYRRTTFFRKVTLVDSVFNNGAHRSAESEVLDQLFTDQIWQLVMRLPDKLREVLTLHAHQHMSYAEMSTLLEISEVTIRNRLHRARVKMKDLIKESEQQ